MAETALKQAIECDQRFLPAYHNLALLYTDRRDWPSCIYYAEIAERQGPPDKEVELALGDAFMALGEQRRALQHLVAATLIDSGFVEAYESMSAAYVDLAMYDLSVAAANQALKPNPESWMALANIGYSYSMQGRFQDAINMQLEALEKNPDAYGTYKVYWGLGWAYLQVDQYNQALDYTERAIDMREQPDLALSFNRALILLAQRKLEEANNALAHAHLGQNYNGLVMFAEAEAEYLKAIELDSKNADFINRLAINYDEWGKTEKAIDYYQKTIQLKPNHVLYLSLGTAYEKLGKPEDAAKAYQESLKIKPTFTYALYSLALLDAKQDRPQEAIELLRKVVKQEPRNVFAQHALGVLYVRTGEEIGAMQQYYILQTLNPTLAADFRKTIPR